MQSPEPEAHDKVLYNNPDLIGHFHDGIILLQPPEFISFSFSNANFVIPVESKEQNL